MTTYQIKSPAAAQRYFEQSFVGDVAAFIGIVGRRLREFAAVVARYTRLAHAADSRR